MHSRNVVVLVYIAVLVSLGVTQMADAAIPTFTSKISVVASTPITITGLSEAGSTVKLFDDETLVDTVTATSGTFEFTGVALDEGVNYFTVTASDGIHTTDGDETLDIHLDTTPSVFTDTFTTATAKVGDVVPTLACTDSGNGYTFVSQTLLGTFDLVESTSVTYTCIDIVYNQTVQTVVYNVVATPPAVPTDISIASDNADTSLAKSGDIVTITFDTEDGSTVEGTIGGGTATFTFNGTSSTLTRTLDGTESSGVLAFSFVQTDATGNAAAPQTAVKGTGSGTSVTADFVAPAVPNHISIRSNNDYYSSFARYGDTVSITFDLATGSTFTGSVSSDDDGHDIFYDTVGYDTLYDTVSNNTGILLKTLSGNENRNDLITFSLVIIDAAGNAAAPQTTVRGLGAGTSVTTDFIYPTVPTDISIAHNGAGTDAVLGDIVTVTFDTDTDATRTKGTIGGKNADYTLVGTTTGKLARTLDGTESPGVLAFSFRVFDHVGNGGTTTQTAVKGTGVGTSVTADFAAPAIPAFTNSTATVSTSPVILAGTAEADSTVELFKGVTSVTTVTATGGTFEFAGVVLAEGSNSFTIAATDAASNVSAKSGALVITLDTVPPSIPTFTKTISVVASTPITITGLSEAGSTVKLFDDETLVDTVTATSGTFEFTGVALDEDVNYFTVTASDGIHTTDGDETLDIYLDTTPPVFTDTFTTATAKVGDVVPTLACTDSGNGYTFVSQTLLGTFDLVESTSVTYTCIDIVYNQTVQTVVYDVVATPPAVPTDISIASNNADTSLAKIGDIVTITFDTEEGSTVEEGTIGGGTATFTFNGTSSTLARTLDGTESSGVLAFSFVQTDATGNDAAAPQTAVKGTGSGPLL